MSRPRSIISVCSGVVLNNAYLHTIWFENHNAQLRYFQNKVVKTFTEYTYLRRNYPIKVEATMEEALHWNYLFFLNGANQKTYFYFINSVEYINDSCVQLNIEMDVMQTYLFDHVINACFVEREHTADDSIGANLIDEGLELGELVNHYSFNVDMQDLCVLVLTSLKLPPWTTAERDFYFRPDESTYDKVYSGLGIQASDNYLMLHSALQNMDEYGKSDAVVNMWMYPKRLLRLADGQSWDECDENAAIVPAGTNSFEVSCHRPVSLDGYTPRNKKLLTYPYNLLYVTNNEGASAIYKYEHFLNIGGTDHLCYFRVTGTMSAEAAVKMYPVQYKGIVVNYDEGIMGPSYPSCAWNQDVYKLWLAQNQHQHKAAAVAAGGQILAGTVAAVGSIATGNVLGAAGGVGMAANGALSIQQQLAQKKDMSVQPPQAKGNYSASINIANEHQTFTLQLKTIDAYRAKIIDGYFDMYGYKTNAVKVPNRNVRENYCYCKTINAHVTGNIGTEDLLKLQTIYDGGVTFWKNGDKIGFYNISNGVVVG